MIFLYLLVSFGLIWLLIVFPCVRCVVFNLFKCLYNAIIDFSKYLWCRESNKAEKTCGKMICFSGLFGKGKTLSEVHYVRKLYNRYNGKKFRKSFSSPLITQKVYVLSNITLNDIPYIPFTNLNQLVELTKDIASDEDGVYKVVYVIIDELQNLLYCRNFKTNLSSDVLMVLTQIRKLHCTICYTSTRFSQTDATVRQDTSYVVDCNKLWRISSNRWYDAWDYENAMNVDDIKPVLRSAWFVCNSDYNAYNTHALTEVISKDVLSGNVIPLEMRNVDLAKKTPDRLSRKGKKHTAIPC